jgi:excisionase family DNA binding protein
MARRSRLKHQETAELMTRNEAAAYLGITPHTLAVWKSIGRYELPVIKVGRLVKYRRTDLDQFLNANVEGVRETAKPVHRAKRANVVDFAEVRLVERNSEKTAKSSDAAPMEVIMPSGIRLRLSADCPPDFLGSVISVLESN